MARKKKDNIEVVKEQNDIQIKEVVKEVVKEEEQDNKEHNKDIIVSDPRTIACTLEQKLHSYKRKIRRI